LQQGAVLPAGARFEETLEGFVEHQRWHVVQVDHLSTSILAEVEGYPVFASLLLGEYNRAEMMERLVPNRLLTIRLKQRNAGHACVDYKVVLFVINLIMKERRLGVSLLVPQGKNYRCLYDFVADASRLFCRVGVIDIGP